MLFHITKTLLFSKRSKCFPEKKLAFCSEEANLCPKEVNNAKEGVKYKFPEIIGGFRRDMCQLSF